MRRFPIMQITPNQEIHAALKKKASRYGKLNHPYLVAINALATFQREEAVIDALLGTPYVEITRMPDGQEKVEDRRRPDGIWYGPPDGQPQNTRMSGVVSFLRLDPWNFASGSGLLIPNPWAAKPLPAIGLGTDELILVGDGYQRTNGAPLSTLLNLPANWPES
jgi:hypothetical protein